MSNTGRKKLPTLRESSSTEQVDIFQRDVRKVFRDVNNVLDDLDSRVTTVEGDVQNVTSGNTAVTSVTGVAPIAVTPTVGDVVVSVDLSNVAPASHTHPESDIVNLVTDLTNIQGDITTIQGDIATIETDLAGKIDEVVAGTNLSGGGTSGSVTLNVVDSPTFAGDVTVNGSAGVTISTPNGTAPTLSWRQGTFTTWDLFELASNHAFRLAGNGATIQQWTTSGSSIIGALSVSTHITAGANLVASGNVTMGNAATDAHTITGTLTANGTTGANGNVLQLVAGLPQWSDVTVSEVTGLQTALDDKSDVGHLHDISDVTGLQAALDGKSDVGHLHAISDVTGLQTALDGKQPLDGTLTALAGLDATAGLVEQTGADTFAKRALGVGATTSVPTRADADARYAALSHTHPESDITNLVTDLAGKSDVGHTHPESDITGLVTDLASKVPTTRTISTTAPLAGGGDLSANRTLSISANGISNTLLRDSAALSVIGRSANSTGDPADIAASTDGHVLRRSGTTLGFGTVPASSITGLITSVNAGTNLSGGGSSGAVTLNVVDSPSFVGNVTLGDASTDAHVVNGSLSFGTDVGHPTLSPDSMTSTRLEVTGAGLQPITDNSLELGRSDLRWRNCWVGTGGLSVAGNASVGGNLTWGDVAAAHSFFGTLAANGTAGSNDQLLTIVGGVPKWQTLSLTAADISGLAAIATSGSASDLTAGTVPAARMPALTGDVTSTVGTVATTIAANAVSNTKLRDSAGLSVIGRSASTTGDPADIVASADGQVLRRSGTTLGFGTIPESSVTNLVSDLASKASASSISGTTGKLAKFTSGSAVGNSIISESSGTISIAGNLAINTDDLTVDVTNHVVGVSGDLDVGGDLTAATVTATTTCQAATMKADEYQVGSEVGRLKIGHRVFTSGTSDWSVTPGTKAVRLRMVGGGGGGGGVNHAASGSLAAASGGNSGTYFEKWIDGGGSNITSGALVIGTGGAGGFGNATGSTGGNTTVIINGTLYTATGGKGGPGGPALTVSYMSNSPAANATSSAGDLVTWTAGYLGSVVAGVAWQSGSGGSSLFGSGGVGRGNDANGNDASGYGGGGGGASGGYGGADRFGGNGSPGIVIIEEYA